MASTACSVSGRGSAYVATAPGHIGSGEISRSGARPCGEVPSSSSSGLPEELCENELKSSSPEHVSVLSATMHGSATEPWSPSSAGPPGGHNAAVGPTHGGEAPVSICRVPGGIYLGVELLRRDRRGITLASAPDVLVLCGGWGAGAPRFLVAVAAAGIPASANGPCTDVAAAAGTISSSDGAAVAAVAGGLVTCITTSADAAAVAAVAGACITSSSDGAAIAALAGSCIPTSADGAVVAAVPGAGITSSADGAAVAGPATTVRVVVCLPGDAVAAPTGASPAVAGPVPP